MHLFFFSSNFVFTDKLQLKISIILDTNTFSSYYNCIIIFFINFIWVFFFIFFTVNVTLFNFYMNIFKSIILKFTDFYVFIFFLLYSIARILFLIFLLCKSRDKTILIIFCSFSLVMYFFTGILIYHQEVREKGSIYYLL